MLVRKDRKRESAHQDEADGPSHIQIELAPRHELETQVAVDQPRGGFASHHHRDRVDKSALNLAAARLRHIAGTAWSTNRYLNIDC